MGHIVSLYLFLVFAVFLPHAQNLFRPIELSPHWVFFSLQIAFLERHCILLTSYKRNTKVHSESVVSQTGQTPLPKDFSYKRPVSVFFDFQVVLPTFILEKRSLLEMYADFMSHPDLFIGITNGSSPEERMIRFVEYYLTSFHEGRKGAIAKKPYNPIIGETFHCSWRMPKSNVATDAGTNSSAHTPSEQVTLPKELEGQAEPDYYTVKFVAEQVSHHPPVSGFYAECVERNMCVNAHVWTKSKFLGMSIGVTMVGEGKCKFCPLFISEVLKNTN